MIRSLDGAKRNPGFVPWRRRPGLRFAPCGLQDLASPVGQNTQTTGQSDLAKRFRFTEIRLGVFVSPPHPCHRGVSRSSRTRGELRWTLVTSARRASQGGKTVSEGVAHTTGADSVRQNRVVLTPGVCVSSLVVMWTARPGI